MKKNIEIWRLFADTCQKNGTPAIVQICHPGRQSVRGAGRRGLFTQTMAPSAIPMNLGNGLLAKFVRWLVFGAPREMTVEDIKRVIDLFVDTARLMADSGFAGVQLHGAHGYLLSTLIYSQTCRLKILTRILLYSTISHQQGMRHVASHNMASLFYCELTFV
jgi:2,4-dienoyl-CoA reductase-like NADH-dependent reductase (Old Yellow Enzyme family)